MRRHNDDELEVWQAALIISLTTVIAAGMLSWAIWLS